MNEYGYIKYVKGNVNQKGELSEWVFIAKNNKKIVASYRTRELAEDLFHFLFKGSPDYSLIRVNSHLSVVKHGETLQGGYGDDLSVDLIPTAELKQGLSVEKEHSPDPEIQLDIVKDHEQESLDMTGKAEYYKFLQKMEDTMKGKS